MVASCGHTYHPWYLAAYLFNVNRCAKMDYNKLMHPDWCKSFGIRFFDPKIESSKAKLRVEQTPSNGSGYI
jgi:hypothetical protein